MKSVVEQNLLRVTEADSKCVLLRVIVVFFLLGDCCPFNFHSFGDVTITGERLQILKYTRHSWPLSSEDSLACHTYCDTGHPFIMIISEDLWHSHLAIACV